MNRLRPHHALALIAPLGILVGVPFVNRVHRYVLGLPFLLFWILCCVVLTSVVMAVIGALDRREAARTGAPTGPDAARRDPAPGRARDAEGAP